MYARIMGRLNARRAGLLEENEKGFTLIELLVVVIIIGILAAIAIPVYLGVQNNAKDSAVKSDITNLKTAVVSIQTNNGGTYPAKFGALDGSKATPDALPTTPDWVGAGATLGNTTQQLSYGPAATDGFCIIGKSTTGNLFYATASKGVSTTACTIS